MAALTAKAKIRMNSAYASSTCKSYKAKFRVFMAFCVYASRSVHAISIEFLLAFLEFLTFNKVSASNISNYISAIKTVLGNHGVNCAAFLDPRVKVFTRALMRSRPLNPHIKAVIDVEMLTRIVKQCERMYLGMVYKAAFLLSFFSFLRISNLVPHSINSFDPLKQLSKGDIIFAPPGAHIIVKWSKTLQFRDKIKVLKIPILQQSCLCPVAALKQLIKNTPGSKNSPLFQVKCYGSWVPLSDTRLRKTLSKILKFLNLHLKNITFHSFRRSGATLAFNSNIPLQHIQSHGTWTSDAVWHYIAQDHNASDMVATAFQRQLSPK